jgi:hypothetical protein
MQLPLVSYCTLQFDDKHAKSAILPYGIDAPLLQPALERKASAGAAEEKTAQVSDLRHITPSSAQQKL